MAHMAPVLMDTSGKDWTKKGVLTWPILPSRAVLVCCFGHLNSLRSAPLSGWLLLAWRNRGAERVPPPDLSIQVCCHIGPLMAHLATAIDNFIKSVHQQCLRENDPSVVNDLCKLPLGSFFNRKGNNQG